MRGDLARAAVFLAVLFLLMSTSVGRTSAGTEAPSTPLASADGQYPTTSWALGVVAPEGAGLEGGGTLRWGGVTNVTAVALLPNITLPSGIVYVVLSVMTDGGTVLQAAAGVVPGKDVWMAYSWSIPDIDSVPLSYLWVLNGSGPAAHPGDAVALSILQTNGTWSLGVKNVESKASIEQAFPGHVVQPLRAGDQEVFALESYSRDASTFREMGNLTLEGIFADGQMVTGGIYTYSDWDMVHNPVFAVGSSGTSPPAFISVSRGADGSMMWNYDVVWHGHGDPYLGVEAVFAVFVGVASAVLCVVVLLAKRNGGWRPGSEEPQSSQP